MFPHLCNNDIYIYKVLLHYELIQNLFISFFMHLAINDLPFIFIINLKMVNCLNCIIFSTGKLIQL